MGNLTEAEVHTEAGEHEVFISSGAGSSPERLAGGLEEALNIFARRAAAASVPQEQ